MVIRKLKEKQGSFDFVSHPPNPLSTCSLHTHTHTNTHTQTHTHTIYFIGTVGKHKEKADLSQP